MYELEDVEEGLECARCERCGQVFPVKELLMISLYGEKAEIMCVGCLLYFLGDILGKVEIADVIN